MDKVFHIRTFRSPNRAYREVELDLPATDYELFDLMEQLQLNDPNRIYLEIHPVEEYGYLDQRIQEPGLFQLNALAKRLAELDTHGMAAFEGLAAMDLQKGVKTIPAPLLINYACSGDSCHVVEDAVTDAELGRFLAENDFLPETEALSDAAFELLDFQPRKPPYTVLLNITPFPNIGKPGTGPEPVPIQLPAGSEELRGALVQLGKTDWTGVMAAILDCPVPSMNKRLFLEEDILPVIEWAEMLRTLDAADSLPKYKALLRAADCTELPKALRLAGALDECEFAPTIHTEDDMAEAFLVKNLSGDLLQKIHSHVFLAMFGRDLLKESNGMLTPYGAISRKDGQPIQTMNDRPEQGEMEMM